MRALRLWMYPAALILSLAIAFIVTPETKNTFISAASPSDSSVYAANTGNIKELSSAAGAISFCSPLDSAYISSRYGYRTNPVSGVYRLHGGLDLACGEGSPIYAAMGGTVTTARFSESYGNYIIIDHDNGYQTLYAHCSRLLSEKGEKVTQGDVIALVGSTGNSTGPHLHIEVLLDGERIDPEQYFGAYFQ